DSYNRCLQTVFITGKSGSGKTVLGKMLAMEYRDFFISSSSNDPMYGYAGQPAILLDELRPNVMDSADLLKFLDPYTRTSFRGRYKNRSMKNCRFVVITTILKIEEFYERMRNAEDEPILQLKRRCQTYIRMDMEHISVSFWDSKKQEYTMPCVCPNLVLESLEHIRAGQELTDEDRHALIRRILPDMYPPSSP
ncbi:MAG: hypothetical protein LUI07_03805, partial [Lachnospiraceae bacterium]|nr:hypothetical protein [Lachnospiraceae bacterium]